MEDTEKTHLEEMLTCPVCQDIFKDPRQLPCGHSLCMGCLENLRNHSSELSFRCPDCRAHVEEIDGLHKNYALTSIAEDFRVIRRTKEKQTRVVYCDYCPEIKTLAVKTCLKCEVSLCKQHVKDHLELPVFTGHPLVKPLGDLLERKCSQHEDEVLRYYCSSSRRYICNICAMERKKFNAATDASTVLQRQLTEYMDQNFKLLNDQITESTDSVKKLQENIYRDKMKPAESCLNGVTVVLLFLWFIVLYYAYNFSVENQSLREALEKQQDRVHHIYSTITELVHHPVNKDIPSETENEGILILDMDTTSCFLGVSTDLQTVERVKTKLEYPHSHSRFDEAPQVLSSWCFSSGTHVWEVEVEGHWDIAVSYRSIQRKTKESSAFGNNTESWSLRHSGKGNLSAYHNKRGTTLTETLQSSRIAVEVNFEEGRITFSAVDSSITRLHEFKAKLTKPVCLGLGLHHVDPPSRASIVRAS
ncbi:E3 ubiquitin/ISG15 ligase TRIM25-like [Mugil cephalus]|uniref:E3 ubiquitin/ISG15 ligase TRIM25-like n=1 Tax=Mugil cephalus TaxID=48193 RepID=UPI001FB71596|nr:E3 ubiquitin/ISG15 ligase TRIM25-like [Mugil cephalus]